MAKSKNKVDFKKNKVLGLVVLFFLLVMFVLLMKAINLKQILFPSAATFWRYKTPDMIGTPIAVPKNPSQTLRPPSIDVYNK